MCGLDVMGKPPAPTERFFKMHLKGLVGIPRVGDQVLSVCPPLPLPRRCLLS